MLKCNLQLAIMPVAITFMVSLISSVTISIIEYKSDLLVASCGMFVIFYCGLLPIFLIVGISTTIDRLKKGFLFCYLVILITNVLPISIAYKILFGNKIINVFDYYAGIIMYAVMGIVAFVLPVRADSSTADSQS